MNAWPPLKEFSATIGRLATIEDTNENRASFILSKNGVRIGTPVEMPLPCYAYFVDHESGKRDRVVLFQAEEADGIIYFGGWAIDEHRQVAGLNTDFEIISSEKPLA